MPKKKITLGFNVDSEFAKQILRLIGYSKNCGKSKSQCFIEYFQKQLSNELDLSTEPIKQNNIPKLDIPNSDHATKPSSDLSTEPTRPQKRDKEKAKTISYQKELENFF